ncbi:hypothetical protein PHYBLDRAFT_164919 [Phycomyces blakesleeanus NRRL 1555(-)]|uniref:DUF4218 domain-containing protein n=1 Tax=Phycomyces blakesleeanus (strain ATCC 8743b / DSM 1359 / FGSC 10004 / NBRC 33097 / NRRL 1555) TaxID=763407 RepID=A0A167PIZ0_PHYB8|nr:hypothetical protein PHYBLDRAFT_164919 [Phycomyces blakesleeanus NRRL 1555(-)]OAD78038.1 hypothetical protein PHYBLDRAFT_164919 [Phycomyces blakesleeanus NRRL 1555(-)]|eukprot:XP_018296078.1 hypothetical protein PHYBLDRAFT_164919 [Phycomyces blakesleeanus NRRL 1555(-)]
MNNEEVPEVTSFLISSQPASVAVPSLIINTSSNNNTDLDGLTYRASTPYYASELLKRFSSIEEKKSGYFRAVDWADFFLFVVPTLVAERVHDQVAWNALLGLVKACSLLMSWELSAEEQTSIRKNIIAWNTYLETLFANGDIDITIFTISQHLLQHYPAMIIEYGPPREYSTRCVERAIREYSKAIKKGGEHVGAKSDIEFWGSLRCRLIDESFKGISCLPILIQAFYESKGVECSRIKLVITTSRKAFVNDCVIDSSFAQTPLREAHHVCLQVQVDLFHNVHQRIFFGKVVLFFEHENSGKRWLLALVQVYSVEEYNGVPVAKNGQMKPKVVHLVDVKKLVGLAKNEVTITKNAPFFP